MPRLNDYVSQENATTGLEYLCLHCIGVRALFGQQWLVPLVDDIATAMIIACLTTTSQHKVVVSDTYVAPIGREIKTILRRD